MFIVDGRPEDPSGLRVTTFVDKPQLALTSEDSRPRQTRWIHHVVLHTTKGVPGGSDQRPQVILPGLGAPAGAGERAARCWQQDGRGGGAHLTVDFDGAITQHADLVRTAAYHAGTVNESSIGIEIYQGSGAELYAGQLEVVVALVDWLTRRFGIQRQIPAGYLGAPVTRLSGEAAGADFVGVFGHRDASSNRGAGDPGDEMFRRLATAGYERWDLEAGKDKAAWRVRQQGVNMVADGVPGPKTVAALAARGYRNGLWVARPGDAPAVA